MCMYEKTWSEELMDEPLFAWILILLTIVLHFVIYFFDAKCETITHFGAWGGVRAFIHIMHAAKRGYFPEFATFLRFHP